MATQKLPALSKLLLSSFLTGSKGVKIGKTDFALTKIYDDIKFDVNNFRHRNVLIGV